ncbi:hypothetical protein ES332_A07G159100v1 [Gossypium tomentosum]|uniref:Uncharacterized protein n=1 Tax=Gossypium tomentosum TaxID=34277 RepID=A0A5D2PVN7_GOSTO|nr:hypothetical protein ES332_A07G159100v1 [Gossypium tomentosum]
MAKPQRLLKFDRDNGGPEHVVTPMSLSLSSMYFVFVWRCGRMGRTWQSGARRGDGRVWCGQLEAPKTWAYRACIIWVVFWGQNCISG